MASRICWHCGQAAHQTMVKDPGLERTREYAFAGYTCDECGVMSIARFSYSSQDTTALKNAMNGRTEALLWLPERFSGKEFLDVPTEVAAAASEAHTCFSAKAYRAAILMARAVVEATAKDKGVLKGNLASKIDELEKQGHVRELIKETAHEIRFLGNDMAHGDFVTTVTEAEADDVLAFMDEVLDEVYQAPARVHARRTARQAATP